MESMVYTKICQYCGAVFKSGSSREKYCSSRCMKRAAKERERTGRVMVRQKEVAEVRKKNLVSQEYLSITDMATLIGVSRPTVYKMIADGRLEAVRFSNRIVRVKVSSILSSSGLGSAVLQRKPVDVVPSNCELISKVDVLAKYGISETGLYKRMKAEKVKSVLVNGKAYFPLNKVKKIYENKKIDSIKDWYTVDVLQSITGLAANTIYDFCKDHCIPRKRQGKIVLISKDDWDKARGTNAELMTENYTIAEIMEKYHLSRGHVYGKIAQFKISKMKVGNFVYVNRKEVDAHFKK